MHCKYNRFWSAKCQWLAAIFSYSTTNINICTVEQWLTKIKQSLIKIMPTVYMLHVCACKHCLSLCAEYELFDRKYLQLYYMCFA